MGRVRSEPHHIFGRNVSRLRVQAEMTQEKLAEKADISRSFLQAIEKGAKQPSINVVTKLRRGLNCAWEEILRGLE